MDIKANDYEITMTYCELYSIAIDVRRSLFKTLKEHWVNHQNGWKQNEKQRLKLLKEMFLALGKPDLFEEIEIEAEKTFTDFNKKRGSA